MSNFTCIDAILPQSTETIDILSFDIGEINMGIAKIRFDYKTRQFCILNAMLLNIYHPLQRLNENDAETDEATSFPVDAYYAIPPTEQAIQQLNKKFSDTQFVSRKRARITEHTENALEFATNRHPSNVAKRRRAKLDSKTVSQGLAASGPLMYAQLLNAMDIHDWISDISTIDFILLEQQLQSKAENVAIFASLIMFFESKRKLLPERAASNNDNWHLKPFIKSCSPANKLAKVTDALHENWSMSDQSNVNCLAPTVIRKLLKDHFVVTTSMVNTEDYGKRKISSKKEVTHFFCSHFIKKAQELARNPDGTLPEVCPETVIGALSHIPVNSYAYWVANQLRQVNNVTDAILQAFAWMYQCNIPSEDQ